MNILRNQIVMDARQRGAVRLPSAPLGFTAVELMIVVAIMSILAALAAPNFKYLIDRWRVREASEALVSSLYLARSEAIKRGGNVVLERNPLDPGCTYPNRTGTAYWSCGWFIYFVDDKAGNTKIQSFSAPKNINVKSTAVQTKFKFDRWGSAGLGTMSFMFHPEPDGPTSPLTKMVCVSSGGRIRSFDGNGGCS